MKNFDRMTHDLKHKRFLQIASIFTALAFGAAQLDFLLGTILGYTGASLQTAIILCVFPFLALILFFIANAKLPFSRNQIIVAFALISIVMIWFSVFFIELATDVTLTDYDVKRPFFCILGVLLPSILGVMAASRTSDFLRSFLLAFFIQSIVVAVLYLMLYDSEAEFIRLGGDAGLSIGIILSEGLSAGLGYSMISASSIGWRRRLSKYVLAFSVPLIVLAIILSGTRAAIVGFLASVVVLMVMRPRAFSRTVLVGVAAVLIILVFAITAFDVIPEATITRVTNFQLEGSENRFALLEQGIDSLLLNPLGKVFEYTAVFPAGIEYAHNTLLQILMECGWVALIPLLLLAAISFSSIVNWSHRDSNFVLFFILFVNVLLQSFSSGDAYTPQVWFSVAFLASYRAQTV